MLSNIASQKRDRHTAIAALVMGLFFWLGSFLFISDVIEGIHSTQWERTQGNIAVSEVDRGCMRQASYVPKLTYRYSAAGQIFSGHKITATNNFCYPSKKAAQEFLLKHYPLDARVTVFFNPASPSDAVLRAGDYSRFSYFVIAALWITAILFGVGGWRLMKKSSKPCIQYERNESPDVKFVIKRRIEFTFSSLKKNSGESSEE